MLYAGEDFVVVREVRLGGPEIRKCLGQVSGRSVNQEAGKLAVEVKRLGNTQKLNGTVFCCETAICIACGWCFLVQSIFDD